MPQRQRIKHINTEKLQGEGSFIEIKRVTVNESDEFKKLQAETIDVSSIQDMAERRQRLNEFAEDKERRAREFVCRFIIRWNWVDDDGVPLPQPFGNPEALGVLSDEEFDFILRAFIKVDFDPKK